MPQKKKWITPQKLSPGDRVGVVAPAGPVSRKELEYGLSVIVKMGFKPVTGSHVLARKGFLAGSDNARAEDFMTMMKDPAIKAVFCARGGYGVNRILPLLSPKAIRQNPKIVVGSSDITLLLSYLNQQCDLVAYHGPMVAASFGCRPMTKSRKQFRSFLQGDTGTETLHSSKSRPIALGQATGRLTGGNLTLMVRSLGTPYEIDTSGALLLIEDVNEPPYRIDGMLWQLEQAGKFKNVKGVLLGEMIGCTPLKGRKGSVAEVLDEFFSQRKFPVLAGCPIGHGGEIWTLPVGARAHLDSDHSTLTLAQKWVSP